MRWSGKWLGNFDLGFGSRGLRVKTGMTFTSKLSETKQNYKAEPFKDTTHHKGTFYTESESVTEEQSTGSQPNG